MSHNIQKHSELPVKAGLTLLVLLTAAGPWLPATWLWGMNHATWLQPWVRWVIPATGLLLIWSPAGKVWGNWLTTRLGPLVLDRPLIAFGLVPAVGAAAFWFFRDATHMLGDGQTLAVMISGDNLYHGFDFMTFHLIARLHQMSGATGEANAFTVAAVLSCLSGAGYLAAAAWSARRLAHDATGKALLYFLLVFCAGLQLFFGYMEVYAPLAVFLLVFMTCLIRYLEGRGSLLAVSAAWSAALFFHLNALFLAPLLAAALFRPAPDDSPSLPRRILTVVWPPLAALAVAGIILAVSGYDLARMREDFGHVGSGSGILVTLGGTDGLLTWRHLKDGLNLVLLLAPVPLVLLLTTRGHRTGPAGSYLVGGSLWVILLSSLVHMKLGAVRDWDLFAPHISVLTLAGWYLAAGRRDRGGPSPAVVGGLTGIAILLAVPWFALNADEGRSLARLENTAADLSPYPHGLLHEQFAYHHQMVGNQDEAIRHYRKCGEVCPNHPRFHAIYGTFMLNLGNTQEAAAAYDRSVAADSTYVYGLKMAALARVLNEDYEAALPPARRLAELGGQDAEAAAAHGMAAEALGLTDEAVAAFLRGADQDPQRSDLLERAAGLQLHQGDYRKAETNFRRLLKADPGRGSAYLGLADAVWQDFAANPGGRPSNEVILRLGEVTELIDRVIAANRAQGQATDNLAAWRDQVAAARAGITDR